jgi:hypothetical protein
VETKPGAVCSNPRRGPGTSFYEQTTGYGCDPRLVWCRSDRGGACPVECGKGGRNRGPQVPERRWTWFPVCSQLEEEEGATPIGARLFQELLEVVGVALSLACAVGYRDHVGVGTVPVLLPFPCPEEGPSS